nr:hypothetical protein [Streptomyces sp. SID5468]
MLSTLRDPFTVPVDTAVWNASTPGQYTAYPTEGCVAVTVPTTAGATNNLGAAGPYNATNSAVTARLTAAPNGNGGVQTALRLDAGSGNAVLAQVASGGAFTVQVLSSGIITASATLPTYNPDTHRYWRLAEDSGTFTFSTSADGYTWTSVATVSYAWTATAVGVYFQVTATDTEPPGMAAVISHVNTPLGAPYNAAWPRVEEAWGPYWNCRGGDLPQDRYVDLSDRTRRATSTARGRQYELDQIRAGEASLELADPDGGLDPTNRTGPYSGHIAPYQPYRKRAAWPPTRNLLTQTQATGGDLGGQQLGPIDSSRTGPAILTQTDASGGSFVATASAWRGGTVMQFSVTSAAKTGQWIMWTCQTAVEPGQTYTTTIQVRNITAGTTVAVQPAYFFWDVTAGSGTTYSVAPTTLTGASTAGWTPLSATVTAPANAAYMSVGVQAAAAPSAACFVQMDDWMLNTGATVCPWECPGNWEPIYAGYMERWSTQWELSGTYGIVSPAGVDAMALLSQVVLQETITEEVQQHHARFLYTLGDPQTSTAAADALGGNPSAPVAEGALGGGTVAFGTSITALSPQGTFAGATGTVVNISNLSPGSSINAGASFLDLGQAGITGPATLSWTRMIAFRFTAANNPSSVSTMWGCIGKVYVTRLHTYLAFQINASGAFQLNVNGITSQGAYAVPGNAADGNWHLAIVSWDNATPQLAINLDGQTTVWTGGLLSNSNPAGLLVSDTIGAFADPGNGYLSSGNWQGDLAFAGEFPTALSTSDMNTIYTAWRTAFAGEPSGVRYQRILSYAGYQGLAQVQTGLTTSIGPARLAGEDALSCLQSVVDTENGEHFADRAGTITFRARSARYNSINPAYTFGERAEMGEWPYTDCQLDYDPTHLANLVTVTQTSTGQVCAVQDTTSQAAYFPRTLTRSIDPTSPLECLDAANYLLSRYKTPLTRVSTLVLDPSANPALWPVCLSLELGMRIRINRRPPGAAPITLDVFIERIQVDMRDDGEATWRLQCSPADPAPYALFASLHTTLATATTAPTSTITITATTDTTNPAAAQLGAGQQLVLGLGTPTAETVTVKAVGATSPGWTTAAIVLTGPTSKAHAAGDTVCEPLPAGVNDPATWDKVARFDTAVFCY